MVKMKKTLTISEVPTSNLFFVTVYKKKTLLPSEEYNNEALSSFGFFSPDDYFDKSIEILINDDVECKDETHFKPISPNTDLYTIPKQYICDYRPISIYSDKKTIPMYVYNGTLCCYYDFAEEIERYIQEMNNPMKKSKSDIN